MSDDVLIAARRAGLRAELAHLESASTPPTPGVASPPPEIAAAANDPANAHALEAARAGGDQESLAREFLAKSADELASLPAKEFRRGLSAVKKMGWL